MFMGETCCLGGTGHKRAAQGLVLTLTAVIIQQGCGLHNVQEAAGSGCCVCRPQTLMVPSSLLLEELSRRQHRCACSEAFPSMVSRLPLCCPSSEGQPEVLADSYSTKVLLISAHYSLVPKVLDFSMWEPTRRMCRVEP